MLTIHESARLVGAYAWIEMRLFEVLGSWVATVPEAPVRATLAAHSRHHAWHAELWHGHLPQIAGCDPDHDVAPPADEVAAALDAVAEPASTLDRLVGAYRVALPHLVTTCSRHLELASPLADPPVARTLRIVLGDLIDDWRAGEALVQAVRRGAADLERTALHQARIETLLAAGGGLAGPATPAVDG